MEDTVTQLDVEAAASGDDISYATIAGCFALSFILPPLDLVSIGFSCCDREKVEPSSTRTCMVATSVFEVLFWLMWVAGAITIPFGFGLFIMIPAFVIWFVLALVRVCIMRSNTKDLGDC